MAWDTELKGFIELKATNGRTRYLAVNRVHSFGPMLEDNSNSVSWIRVGPTESDQWEVMETVLEIAAKLYTDQKEFTCDTPAE